MRTKSRKESRKPAKTVRCVSLNGSAWNVEKKYVERYKGTCDIFLTVAGRRHTCKNKVTGARHAIGYPGQHPPSHFIIRAEISGVLSNCWPICKRAGQQGGHYLRRFGWNSAGRSPVKSGDSSRRRGGKDRRLGEGLGDDHRRQAQGQKGDLPVRVRVGRGGASRWSPPLVDEDRLAFCQAI